jgi:lipopolysaccharide transport system ATP-binding protein
MNKEIAIRVEELSKKYSIGKQKDGSLRGSLGNLFSSKNSNSQDFWALKDVSFDIQKGDVVGIIGKNGAGKSTLLKILSQITKPSKGRVEINGRIASLLEVGTGFHPELTGRENIYLNGTILGMTRKEVKAKFDEIVEFSGVEKFIDTPVKHYSSGMYVRLAFAVAAHLEPEILIIDEVLAVGDAEFQKKCLGKMQDVANHGRTVLFVSHDMGAVSSLCNFGIYLKDGYVATTGTMQNVINAYIMENRQLSGYSVSKPENEFYIQKIEICDTHGNTQSIFEYKSKIIIQTFFRFNHTIPNLALGLTLYDNKTNPVFTANVELGSQTSTLLIGEIPENTLPPGFYSIGAVLHVPFNRIVDKTDYMVGFEIIDNGYNEGKYGSINKGVIVSPIQWKTEKLH